uniref:Uncharacterized protein n=1 Tax=Leersia perrieri TaxID=77586 RepID=A0A0D9WXV6_9ORYZ
MSITGKVLTGAVAGHGTPTRSGGRRCSARLGVEVHSGGGKVRCTFLLLLLASCSSLLAPRFRSAWPGRGSSVELRHPNGTAAMVWAWFTAVVGHGSGCGSSSSMRTAASAWFAARPSLAPAAFTRMSSLRRRYEQGRWSQAEENRAVASR